MEINALLKQNCQYVIYLYTYVMYSRKLLISQVKLIGTNAKPRHSFAECYGEDLSSE